MIEDSDGKRVCNAVSRVNPDEARANSRLLRVAPEMFGILERIWAGEDGLSGEIEDILRKVRGEA
jgi:hypothetical protein